MEVGIRQAKAHLSKLIEAAVSGETVVITNHGKPLAEIIQVRHKPTRRDRGYGMMKKTLKDLPPDWESAAREEEFVKLFEALS